MSFWIGDYQTIADIESDASYIDYNTPKICKGEEVPKEKWIAKPWSKIIETTDGRWMIRSLDDLVVKGVDTISDEEARKLIPVVITKEAENVIKRHTPK